MKLCSNEKCRRPLLEDENNLCPACKSQNSHTKKQNLGLFTLFVTILAVALKAYSDKQKPD